MADPLTGEAKTVQLGSPRRLKVVYDTNLRQAHAEGQWVRIQEDKDALPPSAHERKEHKAWDGLVLPVDDPWWRSHYPLRGHPALRSPAQAPGRHGGRRAGRALHRVRQSAHVGNTAGAGGRSSGLPLPAGRTPGPSGRRAPTAIGAAVFRAAAPALPVLMQGYTGWVNAIEAGGGRGLGGRRVIGAVSPTVVSRLADAGIALESAGISITRREVTHLFAEDRKPGLAVPREWVYALPERLAATPGKEAILYVWKIGDSYVRVAVRYNFGLKGKAFTNAARSAQILPSKGKRQGPLFTVLEGAL